MLMYACVLRVFFYHEGDREVVQSGGRVVVGQVGVQVPWRVRCHSHSSFNAELPVGEHVTSNQSSLHQNFFLVELNIKPRKGCVELKCEIFD